MNKILVTGGLGFIGMQVAKLLLELKASVLLFDNLSPQIHGAVPYLHSCPSQMLTSVKVIRGDARYPADWEEALRDVDVVVHLAAETGTAQSMYEISRYVGTNVGGTAALLDYLANHKHNVKKIILASSRSVYGEGAYNCKLCGVVYPEARSEESMKSERWQPKCVVCGNRIEAVATEEIAPPRPASIYAATKVAQEDMVRISAKAQGIPAVILRFQNVYGEGQSLKNPYTGILSIFSNQIRAGKTVNLYEDGQATRDFIHVSDVARAVSLAIQSDGADGKTLNVGCGKPITIERIALLLGEQFGSKQAAVISGQYRIGDIRHGFANISAIQKSLGFLPEVSLDRGLTRFVDWVKQQPPEPDRLDIANQELVSRSLMPRKVGFR
jgi:dTDP-L-rhamnose 4-epimerase